MAYGWFYWGASKEENDKRKAFYEATNTVDSYDYMLCSLLVKNQQRQKLNEGYGNL
ncbi:MAG: hypothetical protein IPK18_01120 [Sphingobacteriales bacterium]|jgi:hypothetical protein|nr:MAG: hypothetical protein IPK18_01120 [Sphingobacteriales bacterium]